MRSTLVCIFASIAAIAAAQSQQQPPDLTQFLKNNTNLTEFNTLVNNYGDIYAALSFSKDITIFAPSDSAFEKIPYSSLGGPFETNNSDIVREVLKYHVINGTHPAGSFNGSFQFLPTWMNNQTYSNVTGGQTVGVVQQAGNNIVCVSGFGSRSSIIASDLSFSGGLVHIIDSFLIPPQNFLNTVSTFNLTAAGGAVVNASIDNYVDTQTDLTIFAPRNAAFQGIGSSLANISSYELAKILDYHIVNGSNFVGYSSNLMNGTVLKSLQGGNLSITVASNSIFVNSARVLQQDLLISNGVLHVIDNILDYNATGVQPNPALPTQAPIIPGSAVANVPFTADLPSSASSFGSSSPTGDAASSSFAVSDMGSAATTTDSSAASSTDSDSSPTSTKKSAAVVLRVQWPLAGAIALGSISFASNAF